MDTRSFENTAYAVVIVTTNDLNRAREVLLELLRKKLVAGGNIIPSVETHFAEGDAINTCTEALIICRTTAASARRILQQYSDTEIEMTVVLAHQASSQYAQWIENSCNE